MILAGCVIREADYGCAECGARWDEDGVVLEEDEAPPLPPVPNASAY